MTITIDIPTEIEGRLRAEAAAHGQDVNTYVTQVVKDRFTAPVFTEEGRKAWETLLDSFEEGDPDEQHETLVELSVALDEDRPNQRSVFG